MQKEFIRHTLPVDTQKKTLFFPVFMYFFFFGNVSQSIAGDVVINEIQIDPTNSQWIELYNRSDSATDISNWILDDDGGSQHFVIPAGTQIDGKGYKIFESGLFNLNKSTADTARLINGGSIEDNYGYTTGPPADASFGREADGGSNWVIFQIPTKGSSNNSSQAQVIPTPTQIQPTSTNAPTPSRTPTPKKTPTPTRTPTPMKTPTPIKSAPTKTGASLTKTPTSTERVSDTKVVSVPIVSERDITALPDVTKVYPTAVLGAKSEITTTPTDAKSRIAVLSDQTKKPGRDSIFIALPVIGIGLLSGGVFYFFKKRREEADIV